MNCMGLDIIWLRPIPAHWVSKIYLSYLQVKHPWKNVDSLLEPLNILHRTVFVYGVHSPWGASSQAIWHSMNFFGLCYCNYQIFLLFPSLPPSPWWTRVFFTALCGSVCMFDCGKISRLSVRVPRSLDWLFPWGPPGSERLSPTTALGSFFQQPLVVAMVAECLFSLLRTKSLV